jgi:PadR family transcriptional regulator, regulatory protein PadR
MQGASCEIERSEEVLRTGSQRERADREIKDIAAFQIASKVALPVRGPGVDSHEIHVQFQSNEELAYDDYLYIESLHMELLQGTLEMLVLKTLVIVPLHGYGIAKAIHNSSREQLDIEFGSLYPALKRLEQKGWIEAKWDVTEYNKRAKFYRLTAVGRKRLAEEHSKWRDFVNAVAGVMEPLPGGKKP